MTNLDWSKIIAMSHEYMSEQEKEEMFDDVANFDCSSSISIENLKALFIVTQEILKFKGEQVESLMSEIENLAALQGEEEARRHQSLLDQVETLQGQVMKTKKLESLSGSNMDELRQELVKAELRIDQMMLELQSKERDLLNERNELEKFSNQVMILEREKGELKSELAALQRESIEQQEARLQSESPRANSVKQRELVDTIRHKNKHITQLLMDIETLEKENNALKIKVAGVQKDALEKNEKINHLTEENTNLTHAVTGFEERVKILEEKNDALKNQLIEMVGDKERRDDQLDQLGIALDNRLAQWQELLIQKDTELVELKQRLSQLTAQFPNSYVDSTRNHLASMVESLESREEQIEELKQQLTQANTKISECEKTIKQLMENIKSKADKREDSPRLKKMKQELLETRNKLAALEARVTDAENDAEAKAEEMTEMVIQLREYETGVFGLPEAIDQIKELQKQKRVRDRHIEQLIQAGNQLQADANLLEEENLALRERLGLDLDAVVRVDGVLAKYKADQLKLADITQQLEATTNNQLTLKVQNRMYKKTISRLKSQLKKLGFEPEVVSSEDDSSRLPPPVVQSISEETKAMLIKEAKLLEEKLQDVIDENEALRKGMHEILDSVRCHDGMSAIQIESACLERLLEALDSRHLSGWYHPAMRLQAQLNVVEGNNAALREQLRNLRYSEHEAVKKLHKALIQVEVLQSEMQKLITASQSVDKENSRRDSQLRVSAKALEFIGAVKAKKEAHLTVPAKETIESSKLEKDIDYLSKKLNEAEMLMAEQKELYESDKESWQNVRRGLQNEIDNLSEKVASLNAEVKEYSSNWQAIQGDPDTLKSALATATMRLAYVSSENEKMKRKCSVVQEIEQQAKQDRDSLQENITSLQFSTSQKIHELERAKIKLEEDLKILQGLHSECYPISELEDTKKEFNKLTIKYRELLTEKNNTENIHCQLIDRLRSQIELLETSLKDTFSTVGAADQISDAQLKPYLTNKKKDELNMDIKSHAEKMYNLLKDQLKESEDHCKELEKQLAAMVQQNLNAQLIEAELRDQLVDSVSHSQLQEAKKHLTQCEKVIVELKAEKSMLVENLDSSDAKMKALEQLRHCHDYQHDALQRQVLELTASSEDKVTIGRLTRELLRVQESELATSKLVLDSKSKIEKLESLCSEQNLSIKHLHDQFYLEKSEMQQRYRFLAKTLNELHQRYLGNLSLLSAESLHAMMSQARFEKTKALAWAAHVQAQSSDKLFEALRNKYNEVEGNTASKLQDLKLKIKVQSLESQLNQTEGQLQRIDKLSTVLQEELLNQEKSWEKKQIVWEKELLQKTEKYIEKPQGSTQNTVEPTEIQPSEHSLDANVSAPSTIQISVKTDKKERETMTSPRFLSRNIIDIPTAVESDTIKSLNNQLNQVTVAMNEQTKTLNNFESEVVELRTRMECLKKQLEEKERKLLQKDRELLELQSSMINKDHNTAEEETTEILALKATVASLQNIVNQKEETIGRYHTLLQECRDEHGITVANLQEELTALQQVLDKKDNTVSKEKIKENSDKSSAMKVILERYLARVRQLEDDLAQCRDHSSRLSLDLTSSQQQTDKWTHTAEERLKTIQEMKQRLDSARSKDDLTDSNSELMEKSAEIEELNKIICNLKGKLESRETVSATRDRLRGELDRANKRLDVVQNQNAELKAEVQRLRKQLTIRQTCTPKSEAVSTAREETLQKKIKTLEEQVSEYQAAIQRGKEIHKSKCDEEFVKWEERKRWQASNDKLKAHLKEKSSQVEALRANIDRLKDTVLRMEKEKISLEAKLKTIKNPNVSKNNLVDDLERDRAKLQEELRSLRMSSQSKSPSDSSLTDVIEAQERKIVTLKVAQKGEAAVAEEVERLLESKTRLQQTNLRLEAQNLELKMQLEKCRLNDLTPRDAQDVNSETESVGNSPKGRAKMGKTRGDLERAVVVLKRVVEKLQAENKKLHAARLNDVHDKGYVEKLQIELQSCQENYLDAMDKCSVLEEELNNCKEKLSLFEQDDLAEELSLTKAQLAQKCQLLSKVKVLLENAVIREKALKEQVLDLEKLVPPERLRGTYHERRT